MAALRRPSAVSTDSNQPPSPRLRQSIVNRLRWSFLVSSTVPLLLVGLLLLRLNQEAQETRVYAEQRNSALRVARDVGDYLDAFRQQLDNFALLVRPGVSDIALANAAQRVQTRNYPNMYDLAVINVDAEERLRILRLQSMPPDRLRSFADDPDILAVLQQGSGRILLIETGDDRRHVVILMRPIRSDTNAVVGVLRAELSAEPMLEWLRAPMEIGESSAYLVDSGNAQILIDDGRPNFEAPENLRQLLESPEGIQQYSGARKQSVVASTAPVLINAGAESVGWSVVLELPTVTAFAETRRSLIILSAVVVLVGVIVLGYGLRQARAIVTPLNRLRDSAQQIGSGNLEHRIAPAANDEFGDLAESFNRMAEQLQRSRDEIERQNQRLRDGLLLARDIQLGLLPRRPPWNADVAVSHATLIPADEVGGDFYTYASLGNGQVAIAIGDISGKGVGAALLMALTSNAVELLSRHITAPGELLAALNRLLTPRLRANRMNAAILLAVLDIRLNTVRLANAGMIAPIIVGATGCRMIDIGGLPVGMWHQAAYPEQEIILAPGDTLLMISDGVVEAHNTERTIFGFERLETLVCGLGADTEVQTLVEGILVGVRTYMGTAEQHDDMTIVAIRPSVLHQEPSSNEEIPEHYVAL